MEKYRVERRLCFELIMSAGPFEQVLKHHDCDNVILIRVLFILFVCSEFISS